jgi:hypothetical protein
METNDYDEIPLCTILFFVRGTELLEEECRWRRTIDQKMVAMHGSLRAPNPLILTQILVASFAAYLQDKVSLVVDGDSQAN